MERIIIAVMAVLALLPCAAATEGFRSRQYSATDGLPNHTVRHIMQDSHGFIWIATLNGLTRFDGSGFTTFRSVAGDRASLSDNRVTYMTEDRDNYLWIETTGRIYSCFDLRKGRFVSYTDTDPDPYNRIFIASNGDVWLSNTDGGALKVSHLPGRRMKAERFDASGGLLPADKVKTVYETPGGDILLGTPAGFTRTGDGHTRLSSGKEDIFSFFESKGQLYAVTSSGKVVRISDTDMLPVAHIPAGERVTGAIPDDEGLVLFTDRGTWLIRLKTGEATPHPELDIKGGNVFTDNNGRHWVYNHTGRLTYLSKKDHRFHTLQVIPPAIMSRTDHERYRVVEDSEGTIWISTYGNGLFAFREDEGVQRHFTVEETGMIGSNSLRGMMLDSSGALWLGTGQSGISTLWRDNREIRYFLPDPANPADRANSIRTLHPGAYGHIYFSSRDGKLYDWNPGDTSANVVRELPANVYAMLSDTDGGMLVGTRGDGLYSASDHYRHSPTDPSSLPDDNIYFIHRDRKGRIWIGTFGGGIALMSPGEEAGVRFRSFFGDIHGRKEQRHLIEDLDGRFWIGTSEGLLTFHPDSLLADPARFRTFSKTNGRLECNEVRYLLRDSKGELWIATGNDGVIRAMTTPDGDLAVIRHYTAADGLANNSVQAIAEDDGGNLWIATQYGLSILDPTTETFDNYIFSDHPQENTYAEGSVLKRNDGTLLFGTSRGLVSIDPHKFIAASPGGLPLRFTNLTVNGSPALPGGEDSPLDETLDYTDRIVLKPHQNSISVDFTVPDYRDSGHFRYSYIMEGYDKEWSRPSPEATATFSYLPAGHYRLKVRCLDGGRTAAESELEIIVKAPWWNTPWAWIVYAVALCAIAWWIMRIRRSRHREESADGEPGTLEERLPPANPDSNVSEFMVKVEQTARENLSNPQFGVDDFAASMNLGRAVFYRKLKELADTTPNEYLKKMRLREAARLLREAPELNIGEIADRVGFSDSLYLSKCFKTEYGLSPSAYRKNP